MHAYKLYFLGSVASGLQLWRKGNAYVSCKLLLQVNVSELGLVTPGGKVVWGKYAQVTNNPENDGCINAVLLV